MKSMLTHVKQRDTLTKVVLLLLFAKGVRLFTSRDFFTFHPDPNPNPNLDQLCHKTAWDEFSWDELSGSLREYQLNQNNQNMMMRQISHPISLIKKLSTNTTRNGIVNANFQLV